MQSVAEGRNAKGNTMVVVQWSRVAMCSSLAATSLLGRESRAMEGSLLQKTEEERTCISEMKRVEKSGSQHSLSTGMFFFPVVFWLFGSTVACFGVNKRSWQRRP
jgi:hypothetical protein